MKVQSSSVNILQSAVDLQLKEEEKKSGAHLMKSWLLFYAIFTLSSLQCIFKNKETHDSIQDQKYFGYYTGIQYLFFHSFFFFPIFLYVVCSVCCFGDLVENLHFSGNCSRLEIISE